MNKPLIIGGAGFIESLVIWLILNKYTTYWIYNLNSLISTNDLEISGDVEEVANYFFLKNDFNRAPFVDELSTTHQFDRVTLFPAKAYVDRSIHNQLSFVKTNVIITKNMLNLLKKICAINFEYKFFYRIFTDSQLPYSASKSFLYHFNWGYGKTYNPSVVISNYFDNYRSNQYTEKYISDCVYCIKNKKPLSLNGKFENIRNWLFVVDHSKIIDVILYQGKLENINKIVGFNEWKNIDIVERLCDEMDICDEMDKKLILEKGQFRRLLTFVTDRASHDMRYAINASKIKNELGLEPSLKFEEGLEKTVDWYLYNQTWLDYVTSGYYQNYYQKQYQ